jgi:hypothetical protein
MSKKRIALTAFLMALVTLAIIIPLFWVKNNSASPLGKTIIVYFTYPDGTPIGECLEVQLYNCGDLPIATAHTDSEGKVVFPGLDDQTYTWKWSWQGIEHSDKYRITCSKITWEFTETVDYWTIIKYFYYEETGHPVQGLQVHLNGLTETTDANGMVQFNNLKAGDYTIEWVWGGQTQSESVEIKFQTPSPVVLTNYLEPKSG